MAEQKQGTYSTEQERTRTPHYSDYQTSSPVENSGAGGSSGMSGEGYAQAGASTFNTAVSWITYGQEKRSIQKMRGEDLAMAQEAQREARAQQSFENRLASEQWEFGKEQAQEQSALAQETFDFGKYRWGEEFGFTRKQYQDNLKMAKKQEKRAQESFDIEKKRSSLDRVVRDMNNILGDDIAMKKYVASNFGA